MTATIVDQRCPACGHLVGQEELVRVLANINRLAEEKMNGEFEALRYEIHKKNRQIEDMQHNIDTLANQKATSKIEEMERKHKEELEQTRFNKQEEIARAVKEKEWKHQEERAGYRTQIERLEKDNRNLSVKVVDLSGTVEEQKKKIENMSSEFRGTRGEIHLLDILQSAFPNDKLVPKQIGVEMADVIQTVVTENGEKIAFPIVP